MKYYLYNSRANNGIPPRHARGRKVTDLLDLDYPAFFRNLAPEDEVVLMGGDGTLNHFINSMDTDSLRNRVYLLSAGTGNDFLTDIGGKPGREILINRYLKRLPKVCFNGTERKFINGVGLGMDGCCCEEVERLKAKHPRARISYTLIALKELLFRYRPRRATVTVDGESFSFDDVWLCSTMKGRFYGGGMMVAPRQYRSRKSLTVMGYRGKSRLLTLLRFPAFRKGRHAKDRYKKCVSFLEGFEIEVSFSEPCTLQIDGETVPGVLGYTVKAQ